MSAEVVPNRSPLEVVNQHMAERIDYYSSFRRGCEILGAASFGWLIPSFIESPQIAKLLVSGTVGFVALAYVIPQAIKRWHAVRGWVSEKDFKQAREEVKSDGTTLEEDHDLEQFGRYSLAQQIRATKLFLAQHGKLDQYREFTWLNNLKIPSDLKPTEVELDEVDRWVNHRQERLHNFVDDLAKKDKVFIQCGYGISPENTRVYLFKDQKDPFNSEHFPLIEVMRGFGAKHEEIRQEVRSAIDYLANPRANEGVHSYKGRQRLADFFGRPVVFYEGAEPYYTTEEIYGVKQPTVVHMNSLPEHFYRLRFRADELFTCLISVDPTAKKLVKIGLEYAKV